MEQYAVCEEIINGKPSGCYSIRMSFDTNPARFIVIKIFDSYEEADDFIHYLLHKDIFL